MRKGSETKGRRAGEGGWGESWRVLIDEVKSGGSLSEAAMPEAGPH